MRYKANYRSSGVEIGQRSARPGPIPCRFLCAAWLAILFVLGIAPRAAEAATIYVTYTQQKVTGYGGCSLQEAIYSANCLSCIGLMQRLIH